MATFKRYTYGPVPAALPVWWRDDDIHMDEMDDAIEGGGFDPEDPELGFGRLFADWNGHPAGAIVVSGLMVEGHPFAVGVP